MNTYESYLNTAEAVWYSEIPMSWKSLKMRELFSERRTKVSDRDYAALSVGKMGVVPQLETAVKTDNGDNRKLICVGDFAINSRSDRKGAGGISEYAGSCSLIITVLKPNNELNGRFYHYLLRSHYFSEEFYRNGFGIVSDLWTTKWKTMRNIYLPVPPRSEQDQIVRFLDWKVSNINGLISTKRKQIALLHERLSVHISKVVTHGLNEKVHTKDSEVEWIGDVPKHWNTIRCKYLFSERDERSAEGLEQHLSMSQKYGLVPDSQLDERRMLSESYKGGKLCYENDLVLNRLKAHLGVFALSPQLGVISPDYTVLMPNTSRIMPAFAETVLKSERCRRELRIRVRGIVEGFWRLYTDDFNTIVLPVPPIEEQKEIMEHINAFKESSKKYEDILTQEITALQELKTRIISDVVTGKIDVRSFEIPDYEYVADETDADSDEDADVEETDEQEE
ncbi:MAG: restriction endonuclease subunit S [Lachnospiraceae bacterium]|nr:restriction endonuclease subunit S [Lachnospiraceae bacterium]